MINIQKRIDAARTSSEAARPPNKPVRPVKTKPPTTAPKEYRVVFPTHSTMRSLPRGSLFDPANRTRGVSGRGVAATSSTAQMPYLLIQPASLLSTLPCLSMVSAMPQPRRYVVTSPRAAPTPAEAPRTIG